MKILHVCETLPGGPASYFEEVLPYQTSLYGAENIMLLIPEEQLSQVSPDYRGLIKSYAKSGRNIRSFLALALAIRSAIRIHNPSIIHLHSSFAGAVGRIVPAGVRHRPKVIYCAHGWSFDRPPKPPWTHIWMLIERVLARSTDLIVNVSPHEARLLLKNGFSLERVTLVENGVKDLPNPAEDVVLSARESSAAVSLLFVGRMDEQKGFDLLLEELEDVDPGRASLTVAGSAIIGERALSLNAPIKFLGWISRDQVNAQLQEADAVVLPSRWEGMPIAAIEAFRMGCPILVSNRGPFPYMVDDGVSGVVMDIDQPGFLARAIATLEKSNLSAMRVAARSTYKRRFHADRLNRELANAYASLFPSRDVRSENAMLQPAHFQRGR